MAEENITATTTHSPSPHELTFPPYIDDKDPFLFISYSHAPEDAKAVKHVLGTLYENRFRFWYDKTMETGIDFRDELTERIQKCQAVILFVSKNTMSSMYCGMEIVTAYKYDKKIYPIRIDDTEISPAFKIMLDKKQYIHNVFEAESMKELVRILKKYEMGTVISLATQGDIITKCQNGNLSMTIPKGIRIIGAKAFNQGSEDNTLEEIDIGDEVEVLEKEAFRGCSKIKTMLLKKNVRRIDESCFRDCTSMKDLTIESGEVEIGERAFENCAALENINLDPNLTEIYGGAFNSCKALKHIVLPDKLTVLGESAFADCSSLESVVIPNGVTKIDDMVFNGCSKLASVKLNNKLTKIGKNAFKDCTSLTEISIPASVNSIGTGVLRGCTNLRTIEVDPKNKCYKSVDNILYNKNKSKIFCYAPKNSALEFEIPDSVTNICNWSLCNTNLKKVIIPDSVVEIGEGAFCNCYYLEELDIPDSVTKIDDSAFRGCASLKRVVFHSSSIDFGWGVFSGCDFSQLTVVCAPNSSAAKYCDMKDIKHENLK